MNFLDLIYTDAFVAQEVQKLRREKWQVVSTTQDDVAQLKRELKLNPNERKERESTMVRIMDSQSIPQTKYNDRAKIRRVVNKGFTGKEKVPVPEELKVTPHAFV